MNYHTDEWIMEQLNRHYEEALKLYPEERIVCLCLQGSQNYGIDYEDSDIDTKLILTPTLDEIIFNKKPISTTHVLDNDEHLDAKDIRLYLNCFRKGNPNFTEILFTEYQIINPMYKSFWMKLIDHNEEIARYDKYTALKALYGVCAEKHHALCHPYPSKMAILDKYGFDGKQLCHLVRMENFIHEYIKGHSYKWCLDVSDMPELIEMKKQGYCSLEEAKEMADKYLASARSMVTTYLADRTKTPNPKVDEILNEVQRDIVTAAIRRELEV